MLHHTSFYIIVEMSGIGRNQIISHIPNALLLGSPVSHPMTSHRRHILPPTAPVFSLKKCYISSLHFLKTIVLFIYSKPE